ncbi:MAG: DNA polymerase III subunit delta [Eggerthellaceae bacterium]|nr:DNA polymerase III subunit delta [Eggerthellaceae bacterium]
MADSAKDTLLPAYLVVGEDALKRQAVLARLRARIAALGDLEFNSDDLDGETAVGADIVTSCNTMPFASDARLVYVRNADRLRKADSDALVDYLTSPSPTTVLALEAEKLAKNTRLYKAVAAVGKTAVIDCAPPKRYELPRQVRAMAVTHGVTFTDGAAAKLVDLVGEDTVRLDAEIRKIALAHRGTGAVTDAEVSELTARTAEVKPWELTDALAARDLRRCLEVLGQVDASPHALIAMCVSRVRELMCAQSMAARGGGAPAVARALKLPDWRVKNHLSWARRYTAAELRRALATARDAEQAMKSGADEDAALRDWVISVTAPAPRR